MIMTFVSFKEQKLGFPKLFQKCCLFIKTILAVEYFCKMHHFRCFNMLWIGLYSRAIPKSVNINKAIGKRLKVIKWTGPTKICNDVGKPSTIIKKNSRRVFIYGIEHVFISIFTSFRTSVSSQH